MITSDVFFSFVFLVTSAIYASMGVYILLLNTGDRLNRLFFLISGALTLWGLAYSMGNAAPNAESALFWHRVASIGWGVFYSFMVHFLLILAGHHDLLKKRIIQVLLYLPALVIFVFFGPIGSLPVESYHLIKMPAGWIDTEPAGMGETLYRIYYILYSMIGLRILMRWKKQQDHAEIGKTTHLIIGGFILAFILATVTDVLLRYSLTAELPQMGIVFALFPMLAFYRAVMKHGLMTNKETAAQGQILNETSRLQMFRYVAFSFAVGSVLNMGGYFLNGEALRRTFTFSALLFLCGVLLLLLPRLPLSTKRQDNLLMAILAGSYPLIMLYLMGSAASHIAWPVPLILMIISAVYSHRSMLVMVTLSAVMTHLWIWRQVPEQMVRINAADHVTWLGIYLLGAFLAYYVNRTYVYRLKENMDQTNLQRVVANVSAAFVQANEANLDEKINYLLAQAGSHFQVDRSYLFKASEDMTLLTYEYEWCHEHTKSGKAAAEALSTADVSWWMDQLTRNRMVHIPAVAQLPPEASNEKKLLESQQILSTLALPIMNQQRFFGFIGFDSTRETKNWQESHREVLSILANLVSDALVKISNEAEINQLAYYDSLTGLANRSLFNNRLQEAIAKAAQTGKRIGLLFLDLDSFKSVNDTMGHEGGDQLLVQAAGNMSRKIREQDTLCRFGGDEFLILFPEMETRQQIQTMAENIMEVFGDPIQVKEQEFFVTASGGIAVYPEDGTDAESLIKNADLAMYHAKDQGKNQVAGCTPTMKQGIEDKTQLTSQLYRAIERQELVLYYQPQININTGQMVGVEALVRWQHPEKGLIPPGVFIPLAEQTGLINAIGRWVLETASRQNKAWQNLGLPLVTMAVNLSVEQFRNPRLVEMVYQVLQETGLSSACLELEITESIAIKETTYPIALLQQLKHLGVTISIDDFGTEYSSLSRIKELPVDRLKIAMEFVHGIDKGGKDQAIARSIIHLAKSLGLSVIAEGVETLQQLQFLKEQQCDDVQGFHFYKPMPAPQIEALLRKEMAHRKKDS
ncbi:EAL domain-containing protein [Anoxynatronum buryatiense]|uniref:Diguanylate cyclase (GGDEF) domain-containing protein n=1 Tax=Anoxynatronum buryatiense TaxID=489973 RepID=A0AA45WW48_9CLOT|nr:EAL domain-containing protein [Anoxynatronum buryatiense]SMP57853.1 diguanylate cyclase (GGDEF) domain-containing protein [Anoxynatronum buryatiense]